MGSQNSTDSNVWTTGIVNKGVETKKICKKCDEIYMGVEGRITIKGKHDDTLCKKMLR